VPAGIPAAATAAALGAIQVDAISNQPLPKFKKGGKIKHGARHEHGGSIIEAEKGEFVMPVEATRKYEHVLEAMRKNKVSASQAWMLASAKGEAIKSKGMDSFSSSFDDREIVRGQGKMIRRLTEQNGILRQMLDQKGLRNV